MKRFFVSAFLCIALSGPIWAEADRVITVTGQGNVDAVPDVAMLSIAVTREARMADEALAATSQAMAAVFARFEDAGIEARDIQTQGLSVQPRWSRPNNDSQAAPRVTGFVARNGVRVRIRDLAALGALLNDVVADGANTLERMQFGLADPEAALAEARTDAVKDGLAKAAQMADAAGLALGPVQSMTELTATPRAPVMAMASARADESVPIARGEVSLSAQVSLVIELVDP